MYVSFVSVRLCKFYNRFGKPTLCRVWSSAKSRQSSSRLSSFDVRTVSSSVTASRVFWSEAISSCDNKDSSLTKQILKTTTTSWPFVAWDQETAQKSFSFVLSNQTKLCVFNQVEAKPKPIVAWHHSNVFHWSFDRLTALFVITDPIGIDQTWFYERHKKLLKSIHIANQIGPLVEI